MNDSLLTSPIAATMQHHLVCSPRQIGVGFTCVLLLLAACPKSYEPETPDAGSTGMDAGSTGVDAGSNGVDAGSNGVDAGSTGVDAGSTGQPFTPSPMAGSILGVRDLIASTRGSATEGASGSASMSGGHAFAPQSTIDPLCTIHGAAWHLRGAMDPGQGDELFARNTMHCATTFNSFDLNTLLGTLTRYGSFVCQLEQALGEELVFGDAPRDERLQLLLSSNDLDNPCMQIAGLPPDTGTLYNLDPVTIGPAGEADPDFAGIIHFVDADSEQSEGLSADITIKLRNDAVPYTDESGVQRQYYLLTLDVFDRDGPNAGERFVTTITLDKLTGTLRMVGGSYNPNDPDYTGNQGLWMSLLVQGALVDSRFESLERVEGYVVAFANHSSFSPKSWRTFASQKSPDLVFWQAGYANGAIEEIEPGGAFCETDETCTGTEYDGDRCQVCNGENDDNCVCRVGEPCALCEEGEYCRGGRCRIPSKQRYCPDVDDAACASRPGIEPVEELLNRFYAEREVMIARYAEIGLLTFDEVKIMGNFCGDDDLDCGSTCPAGFQRCGDGTCVSADRCCPGLFLEDGACQTSCNGTRHDGGDTICVEAGTCSTFFVLESDGTCQVACHDGRHDGGAGVCIEIGRCSDAFLMEYDGTCLANCLFDNRDGGDGVCVSYNLCSAGYHEGGDGVCVAVGTCSVEHHDGGDGACVRLGRCSAGFFDRGDGTCMNAGPCLDGYRDGGDGNCVLEGSCSVGYHDGGDGVCVAVGSCSASYHDNGTGLCVLEGCADNYHDDGVGQCVPSADGCAATYHLNAYQVCVPFLEVDVSAGAYKFGYSSVNCPIWPANCERPGSYQTTRPMKMMAHEVTQGLWTGVSGGPNPSIFNDCARCPVENVDRASAAGFANRLSALRGFTPCYVITNCDANEWFDGWSPACVVEYANASDPLSCDGYRLPTEVEWEYAYRAGTETEFYVGNDPSALEYIAWYKDNSLVNGEVATRAVGQLIPNAFGLYDMAGNVSEMVWELYPPFGEQIIRGGSVADDDISLFKAYGSSLSIYRNQYLGFRLTRTITE